MIRLLNIAAIAALVASAIYAYSIKYQTILRAETVTRLRLEIKTEQDAIGTLRADWANLTRPERVQALTEKLLPLQPLKLDQIVRLDALPDRAQQHGDAIAQKLDDLGLSEPTATPKDTIADAVTGSVPSTATPATPKPAAPRSSTAAAKKPKLADKKPLDITTLAKAAR